MIDDSHAANIIFSQAYYRQLAEVRFQIRRYLQFSEHVARSNSIEPQQHQLMLAIKGLPANTTPTVSALANRLCLRHHSTVELINRLVERGAAVRKPSTLDRRQVLVNLTPHGEELLAALSTHHRQELQSLAPELLVQLTHALQITQPFDAFHRVSSTVDGALNSHSDGNPVKLENAAASKA